MRCYEGYNPPVSTSELCTLLGLLVFVDREPLANWATRVDTSWWTAIQVLRDRLKPGCRPSPRRSAPLASFL
jgi:hypothetical protein